MNCFGALVEEGFLFFVEVEFNDFLNTVTADDAGHADAEVAFAIFAVEKSRARDKFLLVVEHGGNHLCRCSTGCIPCRSAEKFGKCSTTDHSVGSNLCELVGRNIFRRGHTTVSGKAGKGNHSGVAVAADNDAFNLGCIRVEREAEIIFEACAVECTAHAEYGFWEGRKFCG